MFQMFGLLASLSLFVFYNRYSIDGIFKSTDGCSSVCFEPDADADKDGENGCVLVLTKLSNFKGRSLEKKKKTSGWSILSHSGLL